MWLTWPGVWLWVPPLGLMGTQVLLRFPDGALPSRRWRWFSRLTLALIALAATGLAVGSSADGDGYANPAYRPGVPEGLFVAIGLAALACFPVSMASVVVRYRRAGPCSGSRSGRWPGPRACSPASTCPRSSPACRQRSATAKR